MDLNDHLRALEEALLTPALRRNSVGLAALLTDDFREFGSSGRLFCKAEILDALQTEVPARLEMQDFEATPVGPGAVLVTYRIQRERLSAEVPDTRGGALQSLRSSLWVRREGQWQILFHQGTPVATPV